MLLPRAASVFMRACMRWGRPADTYPLGERQNHRLQIFINASLWADLYGLRVTSDGGLTLIGELDARLALAKLIGQNEPSRVSRSRWDLLAWKSRCVRGRKRVG